jgi:hypothetical protein
MPAKAPLHSKYRVNPETGCWEWIASKDRAGYGWARGFGRERKAHRVVFSLGGRVWQGTYGSHCLRR